MVKITIIGAGSVSFSMKLIQDLNVFRDLSGSTVTFMDIDEQRLNLVYTLAEKYMKEAGTILKLEKTTDRKKALDGADFVINTVKIGGYHNMEKEREIAESHGYYRGVDDRVSDYYGGFAAYEQLKFIHELARDVENISPNAWYMQVSNPVFEGTNLALRETGLKVVGFCHGYLEVFSVMKALDLDPKDVEEQVAGFNHCIFLTKFKHKGEDAYPLIDKWIEEEAPKLWSSYDYRISPWEYTQLSPASVEMYRLYKLFPIGDTPRSVSPWWFHTDLNEKKKWFPAGGPDSEIGWTMYLYGLKLRLLQMERLAGDPNILITKEIPMEESTESIVPFVDAIVNNHRRRLVLNVPNNGAIKGIPDDVIVEIPVYVDKNGIEREKIENIPSRLMLYVLIPRWLRMERILQAFQEGDRTSLLLTIMDDPRTKSFEQGKNLIEAILSQPWNEEMDKHYK
ncbi:MAG TPA: alpha-glucosidase/alpha-galactosidase [Dictyoglomaceae bacterium]|nr:alpha-glucosidase/alpha-galactosidase [Dictyoglomaceae bacterium]HOL39374.1 alpha-glucosidase/alpha-galactosidase [Dictyoglomaceae bacterium]HOP94811.1 alpha-glucosidase/alpha-galactosidase [Dictyoglomaceae bacterium]HPP15944.1 alpha-glucosidase/alpha-galactosidase [Dictyoglomaceae bacterium]HPU43294.1 alpha-glucosidase/alpha-galactosidase [Dictyoglomaceae bacterium]